MGKQWRLWLTLFFWASKSLQMVIAAMKLDAGGCLPAAMPGGDDTPWEEELCDDDADTEDDFLWEDFRRKYHGIAARLCYRIPDSKLPELIRLRKLQHARERRRKRLRSLQMYRMSCQRAV